MSDDEPPREEGCPMCEWDGEVARTFDYDHEYYTHVIVKNGETFTGKTCSMRTREQRGLLSRLFG